MLRSKMKWNITYTGDEETSSSIRGITDLTSRLLVQRDLTDPDAIDRFLHPSVDDLHDPFLLSGMNKAVQRVREAIEKEERILVFGDYDADGVSSTTVMVEALKEAGALCDFYIPNRFTEGYGPNESAFREAAEAGFNLIITVDNGVAADYEAKVAKELGIDLIITDHHEVQEVLPEAYAIIHPKTSENYPFKELAGVGVAFKFAQALLPKFPKHLLDLTALGTVADLVPLKDENRALVYLGLKAMNKTKRIGLLALIETCGIDGMIDEESIGFTIGPRVNAVGRLQDASPAVDLFLTKDMEEARELAEMINELNQERQKIVADIAKEAENMLKNNEQPLGEVIVVAKAGWNPGVLGIVASKLVRTFDRPAIVLGIDEEKQQAKGSARSIDAFDLFSNCMEIRDQFIHFGGHAQAAGMTVDSDKIDQIRSLLCELAKKKLTEEDYQQSLNIEMSIRLEDVSLQQIEEISKLRPFGMGNPKPLFHVKETPKEIRLIGSRQNHLKMQFVKEKAKLDGIGFGMGELYHKIGSSSEVEVVGELSINEWNGRKNPQIMIKDLQVSHWQLFDHRGSRQLEKQLSQIDIERTVGIKFTDNNIPDIPCSTYRPAELTALNKENIDGIVLLDLPDQLSQLSEVIQELDPQKIYACYQVQDGAFFQAIPTREHFKWFYGMLMKRENFNIHTDKELLAKKKGWSRSMIDFISQVFFELGFVKMEDGKISLRSNPEQKDLSESNLYQQRIQQLHIEQTLYYSTYKELKDWLNLQRKTVREEVLNGL
ncbi:single-stranded-DNA-specific exonuclease RecJ [Halobacillus sp. Marseille-Q1614]|uniref:single-stranded-DNA-specific exonuclease RecJ n=1 Tax=Halobacillus sp. Marseille-Q1614 TaxID=2709134 RepID=UPI0015704479|nr:single-stranded-DNA-specific exonuclease RecJ [Halobacillus sp. Marseille-Q1614]